ncbi:MAG: hypothetical protein MJ237_00175 [bacterium]|nr:hypothetical protein [bacterium]
MALAFVRIEHSVKFNTVKEATREADTLRMNIIRYSKRYNIPCTAMIGISTTDLRNAEVVLVKEGKHRPKREIFSKTQRAGIPEQIEPHLHIIIICKSDYTALANYLITRIRERYPNSNANWWGQDIEYDYDINNNIRGYSATADYYMITDPLHYIKYVIRQSSSIRYVEDYTDEIDFDFKGQVRLNLKVGNKRTYFHKKMRKNYIEPLDKYNSGDLSDL